MGALNSSFDPLGSPIGEPKQSSFEMSEGHGILPTRVISLLEGLKTVDNHGQEGLVRDPVDSSFFQRSFLEIEILELIGGTYLIVLVIVQAVDALGSAYPGVSYRRDIDLVVEFILPRQLMQIDFSIHGSSSFFFSSIPRLG